MADGRPAVAQTVPAGGELPAEVLQRLSASRVATLATMHAGRSRLVPVTFAMYAGLIVWAVDAVKAKGDRPLRRITDLERDPRVTLLVQHYEDDDWSRLWWIEVQGSASVLSGAAVAEAVSALVERYEPYRSAPPPGPVVAIEPERWAWWAAEPGGRPAGATS